jgi:indole-3-glycerol phosphate synthase / phosphoribosylanthranilate isomerase
VEKCRAFAPALTGINCRDLATFSLDLLHPIALRPRIDWQARLLFESGIRGPEDVRLALSAGFSGVLVGETAMKTTDALPGLLSAFGQPSGDFWARLCGRLRPGRPLVKICGITGRADAEAAVALGADVLGFVFAESKRRASLELMRELRDVTALKVAVVVTKAQELDALLSEGLVDAVQFHGEEKPEECAAMAFPYYKAVRVKEAADIQAMSRYRCPRVLADAYSPQAAGGTGQSIPPELAREVKSGRPLWLAGGLGPDNVGAVVRELSPELIDASSRLEESPGIKDHEKLGVFFKEIEKNGKV